MIKTRLFRFDDNHQVHIGLIVMLMAC